MSCQRCGNPTPNGGYPVLDNRFEGYPDHVHVCGWCRRRKYRGSPIGPKDTCRTAQPLASRRWREPWCEAGRPYRSWLRNYLDNEELRWVPPTGRMCSHLGLATCDEGILPIPDWWPETPSMDDFSRLLKGRMPHWVADHFQVCARHVFLDDCACS